MKFTSGHFVVVVDIVHHLLLKSFIILLFNLLLLLGHLREPCGALHGHVLIVKVLHIPTVLSASAPAFFFSCSTLAMVV